MNDDPDKKQIAVLGGGIAGLTSALELSDPDNPRHRDYEITVYSQGWRLGGKGASGRNAAESDRIEEHGLHVWLGFYENSFRSMRKVFEEWDISPEHPWGAGPVDERWKHAFHGGDFTPLGELRDDGKWRVWPIKFPKRAGEPGDGIGEFSIWAAFEALVKWLRDLIGIAAESHRIAGGSSESLLEKYLVGEYSPVAVASIASTDSRTGHRFREAIKRSSEAETLERNVPTTPLGTGLFLVKAFWFGIKARWTKRSLLKIPEISGVELFAILIDLSFALLIGLTLNFPKILKEGFDGLDKREFRSWLRRYGARKSSVNSPFISALYDGAFGSVGGSGTLASEDIAAGIAIRALLRIATDYKGHNYWRMQAGMGDTVFTPIYEVLKSRGVKFEFFHRVDHLSVGGEKRIEKVRLSRQATLKDKVAGYAPLMGVPYRNEATGQEFQEPLQCWPSNADYAQLVEGDLLRAMAENHGVDLENPAYTNYYEDPGELTLVDRARAGSAGENERVIDQIILAIPVAALPSIASELMDAHGPFKRMVEHSATVRTVAAQVWLREKDRIELGFDVEPDQVPILTNFRNPLNTWADMTYLKKAEPFTEEPKHIGYFCGPMPDSIRESDANSYVSEEWEATLNELSRSFWPEAENGNGDFDQSLVITEYLRTNTFPSERYTLSPAKGLRYRLRPGESGFANLVMAGDWTRNNFNMGSIEATVMSGMQASHEISGYPELSSIVGNDGP